MNRVLLFVFNSISYIYIKCKSPFTPKSVMNKPQAEGKINHVCTVEEKIQHSSAIKKQSSTIVNVK